MLIKVSFSRTRTNQSIKSNITNNVINNVVNLFQKEKLSNAKNNNLKENKNMIESDKGEHLCFMYCCEEHIKNETKYDPGEEEEEEDSNIKKYKRFTQKENVKCSSCIIY